MAYTLPVLPPLVRKPTVVSSAPPPDDTLLPALPVTPPVQPSASPLHDHVRHIMIANPAATPDQVAGMLGIKSSLAKGVIAEIGQQLKAGYPSGGAASPPPPSPIAQAMAPPVPSSIPAPPAAVANAMQTVPPPPAARFPGGVQAQPPELPGQPMVAQDFGGAIPGYQRPQNTLSPMPSDVAPPPPDPMTQDAAKAREATLAGMNIAPGAYAPPGDMSPRITGAGPPPEQSRHNNELWDGLKRFLPDAIVAALTYKNPTVGAGILGGMARGRAQVAMRDAQQEALDRQKAVDARAQAQQATENAQKDKDLAETAEYHKGVLANAATKNETTADHYKAMAGRYGDQAMAAFGKEVSQYSGNPDAQFQIAQRYDKAHGTTEFSDSLGTGTGDTDSKAYNDLRAKAQQERVDAYGQQVAGNLDDIASKAGLRVSQGNYLDAKTGQVVPDSEARNAMLNATADFLSTRTGVVVPLADADIAYKAALGNAAGVNADAHTVSSAAAAKNADTAATKATGAGGITDTLRQHIYKNYIGDLTGAFGVHTPNKVKIDQDGYLISNPAYYTDENGAVNSKKADEANDGLNAAVSQLGTRYYGKQPEEGTTAPVPAGQVKVTPRSAAGKPSRRPVDFDATRYVGQKVNNDGALGCVDGVCFLAKKAGLPVPSTRNAAQLEKQLPKFGWQPVDPSNIQPNDIVISGGSGPSGRHAQWYIGGNRAVAADTRGSGSKNTLSNGYLDQDGSSTYWRYAGKGASGKPQQVATQPGKLDIPAATLKTMSTADLWKTLANRHK